MDTHSNKYTIIKGIADDTELESYRQCFEKNGTERDIKNLQWLHQQNLTGTHTIYYAMEGEQVAAIYTAMPVVLKINNTKVNALQSIDTITDVAHRGKGLFPKLANKLYDDATKNNYELVYGFPNENSAPGFFKKLQWISFGEAPFLLKPLSLKYLIDKVLKKKPTSGLVNEHHAYELPATFDIGKNSRIQALDTFGEEYDQLWAKVSADIAVAVDRSAAYMNWRYLDKPGEVYSKCGIFIDGKLKGIVVFTIKNKHNGRIGYLMELIFDSSLQTNPGVTLLKFATRIFKQEKTDAVLAWSFSHSFNYKSFTRSGYFNLPIKLRPQHLFLGVRAFNETNRNLIEGIKNWYISYSDSDTV